MLRPIALLLFLLTPALPAIADAPSLFNQAISDAGRISADSPTKERLAAYEKVLGALDTIVRDHPASDEARLILSGQDIGTFSPSRVRAGYVSELTDYFDTVCEATPSYTCLAFVSLKNGSDLCNQARTVGDIEKAYDHLSNALRIFAVQSKNAIFSSTTVSVARQCVAGNLDPWTKDYFGSKLVEMLLVSGDENTARATIENMSTPYFKFEGVLSLKKAEGTKVDQGYLDRLDRFIDENLGTGGSTQSPKDAFLATLRLRDFAISNSDVTIPRSYVYDAVQKYRNYGDRRSCDSQYVSYLFNLLLDYQVAVAGIPQNRRGIDGPQIPEMMDTIAVRASDVMAPCSDGEYYQLPFAAQLHGRILVEKGADAAVAFRKALADRSMTREEMVEYYLSELDPSVEDIIASYVPQSSFGSAAPVWYLRFDADARPGQGLPPSTFPVYKRLVDSGEVCRSAEILFRQIAGSDRFDAAIQYMIDSPAIDANTRQSCGDEDLELLLK
jgi:hypothetical protein